MQNNIKTLRENRGLTQKELADAINVSRPAVAQWETGKQQPRFQRISDIARVLQCDEGAIFRPKV